MLARKVFVIMFESGIVGLPDAGGLASAVTPVAEAPTVATGVSESVEVGKAIGAGGAGGNARGGTQRTLSSGRQGAADFGAGAADFGAGAADFGAGAADFGAGAGADGAAPRTSVRVSRRRAGRERRR